MCPRGTGATIFTFAVVAYLGLALAGLIGLIVTLNLLVVAPFFFSVLGSSMSGDVRPVDKPNITGRIKDTWNQSSQPKKVALASGLLLALPFVLIGVLWLGVVLMGYAIDIIFFVPIVLLVGWLFFRSPQRRNTTVGRMLGNNAVGIIGVIGVVVLVIMSGLNYASAHQWDDARDDMGSFVDPLFVTDEDLENYTYFDPILNETVNGTRAIVLPTLIFKVVDPFFDDSGLMTDVDTIYSNFTDNETAGGILSITDTDGALPVDNAIVTLMAKDKKTGSELLPIGSITNSNGQIIYSNVPCGLYDMSVDAGGYLKWNQEIHINKSYGEQTVIVNMKPIYYKVRISYIYYVSQTPIEAGFWTSHREIPQGNISAIPELVGGISRDDWQRLKTQQSIYGWTGLPSPKLQNSIMPLKQSTQGAYQSVYSVLQNVLPSFTNWMSREEWELYVSDFFSNPEYFNHKVILQKAPYSYAKEYGDAEGVKNTAIYSREIPTLSVYQQNNYTQTVENREAFESWNREILMLTNKQSSQGFLSIPDRVRLSELHKQAQQYNWTIRMDTQETTMSMSRSYEYIIWGEYTDRAMITLQWNITTTFTTYKATKCWFRTKGGDPYTSMVYDDVIFQFENNIPTALTSPYGG